MNATQPGFPAGGHYNVIRSAFRRRKCRKNRVARAPAAPGTFCLGRSPSAPSDYKTPVMQPFIAHAAGYRHAAPDDADASRTESWSESSGEEEPPLRLLDRSSLDLALKHWDSGLAPAFGAAVLAEPNADAFSRFLWRLDVAVDTAGSKARPTIAPWLRTLAGDERARRACFGIAAAAEAGEPRTIMQVYTEMQDAV